ncbi:CpsD/CapB family tyrosine-protein kinase [bacterium]|nr:CpsD/CapB family tyrosine-protein kinase [bacterium]
MSPEKMLAVLSEPRSMVAESYRGLRTSIQRALSSGVHSIMFVSSFSGDGKSSVCCNVAATLTQLFLDVVLVDCDLRRPTLTKLFGLNDRPGLSNFLSGEVAIEELLYPTSIERLRIVPAGTSKESPGDLVGRPALAEFCRQLRAKCDVCLFDTPPVSACSDALSLGVHMDTTAMVVNPRQWDGDVEMNVRQSLESHNIPVMGVILNGTDGSERYGYGTGRYGNKYGYGYGAKGKSVGTGYGYGYEPQADSVERRPSKGFWGRVSSLWGDTE